MKCHERDAFEVHEVDGSITINPEDEQHCLSIEIGTHAVHVSNGRITILLNPGRGIRIEERKVT